MRDIHQIIIALLDRDNYTKWKNFFPADNLPAELKVIYQEIGIYYKDNKADVIDLDDFTLYFQSKHTEDWEENKLYEAIFSNLQIVKDDEINISSLIKSLDNKAVCAEIKDSCLSIINGHELFEEKALLDMREKLNQHIDKLYLSDRIREAISDLDTDDSDVLYDDSYPWRVECLNEYIGWYSNHLIVIGAVPDGGKTAALIGQADYQAKYLQANGDDGIILYFSNEQGRTPMLRRMKSCCISMPYLSWKDLDRESVSRKILKEYGRLDRIMYVDAAGLTPTEIDSIISRYEGKLRGIYIDQMHKIRSTGKSSASDVERLASLFAWGRDIAKSVAPVLTVHQINSQVRQGTYLDMDAFYGIKTQLQGEADVIITINLPGKLDHLNLRYCKVAKSKVYGYDHDPIKAESDRRFFCTIDRQLSRLEGI